MLIYFLYGIIFITLGLPLLQGIADIINAFFQWIVSAINIHIADNNNNITDISNQQPTNTAAIGFNIPNEQTYEDN